MPNTTNIKILFLDIGGVMLNNGWDRHARKKAVEIFKLDEAEVDERHHLTFDTYEEGKITLDEYLDRVIFYTKRSFTKKKFKDFMFQQSAPIPEMIALMKNVKKKNGIRIAVVNNEGRELNEYRINTFGLNTFVDFFISSSFVHIRKPDADIFRLALDIALVKPEEVFYVDDRDMFVQVAQSIGIRGVIHKEIEATKKAMKEAGLKV